MSKILGLMGLVALLAGCSQVTTSEHHQEVNSELRTEFQYYPGRTLYFTAEEVEPSPVYTIWDIWHEEAIQWLLDSGQITQEVVDIRWEMRNVDNDEELYRLQLDLHRAMHPSGAAG